VTVEALRVMHLLGAVLWPLAAALGLIRARRLHRRRARVRMYLLMALGLAVGGNSLVMALADVHPSGTGHAVAVGVLGVLGAVLLYVVASYGDELAEEENVLRALSGGRLGETTGGAQPSKPLTPRELDVLVLVCRGLDSREMARQLGISYNTVITHVHNLLKKVGVSSRVDLVAWAIRVGLYDPFAGAVSDRAVAEVLGLPRAQGGAGANR
jgi:DNA-binding CsgD family transcriptional regulator